MQLKDAYHGGECPDCGKKIPDDYEEGQSCTNCGHVFWLSKPLDEPIPDLATDVKTVTLVMEGGVIQNWHCPQGITLIVRDYDVEGAEESDVKVDSDGNEYLEHILKPHG